MNKKYVALLSALALLSPVAGGVQVQAGTLDDLNREKQQLEQKSQDVQNKINEKESSLQKLEDEKVNLETRVADLQESIDELLLQLEKQEAELLKIENKIQELEARIQELQFIIEQRTEKLNNQARVIQTEASMTDMVSIIMNAESLTDMVGKISTVNRLITANKDIVAQQEADKLEVELSKKAVEEEKVAAEEMKQQIIVSKNNVVAQQNELNHQITLVLENTKLTENEKKKLQSTKSDLVAQTNEISSEIAAEEKRIEAERIAKEKAEAERLAKEKAEADAANLLASTEESGGSPVVSSSASGGFIRPASGYISSPYGMRFHPINGTYHTHNGIDFAGSGPIVAAREGVVEVATYSPSWGYYVIVNHGTIDGNNVKTLYAHMTPALMVAPGQTVGQGQQIGIMGTTGESTGVHLHLEVYENGVRINPLKYFSL